MALQAKIAKYKTCEKKFNFGKLACMLETKYDQVEFAQETGLLGRHGKCVKCNLLTDEHLTFSRTTYISRASVEARYQ